MASATDTATELVSRRCFFFSQEIVVSCGGGFQSLTRRLSEVLPIRGAAKVGGGGGRESAFVDVESGSLRLTWDRPMRGDRTFEPG